VDVNARQRVDAIVFGSTGTPREGAFTAPSLSSCATPIWMRSVTYLERGHRHSWSPRCIGINSA